MQAFIYKRSTKVKGFGGKLARHLGLSILGKESSEYLPYGAIVLNYGRASLAHWHRHDLKYINHPNAVAKAGNKAICLELLTHAGIPCLKFKLNCEDCWSDWLDKGAGRVFCRTLLRGSKGDGIVVASCPEDLVPAPLYTLEYKKTHEYRVHVFNGEVIDKVQKKSMSKEKLEEFSLESPDRAVRNYKRGWVFAHHNLLWADSIGQTAVQAVQTLGLTYGAVDLLAKWNLYWGKCVDHVVCEINTAPGMSAPTTFTAYKKAIGNIICQ